MIKRMNQSKMRKPRRKLTQIQMRKNKKMNKRRKACQTRRKRFAFLMVLYYCRWYYCINRMNNGCSTTEWCFGFQLQRRMKIANLKQICSRPDVVEVQLVFNVSVVYYFSSFVFGYHIIYAIINVWLFIKLFGLQVWDATSADPKLLVFLKSYRNTVPVPRHWCQKRKFLQVSGSCKRNSMG